MFLDLCKENGLLKMFVPNYFKSKILPLSFAAALLASCAVGPDYNRPDTSATITGEFLNAPETQEEFSSRLWWEQIDDPLLPSYIDTLLEQNLDLKEAGARILQARARLGTSRADYFPSLGANSSANRNFSPSNSFNIPGQAGGTERVFNTNYVTELETSWEIDLFGRIRKSVESADASFQASLYDRDALTNSLIAELVNRRIAIATNQRLLSLAEQNAENRRQIYELVQRRYDMGVANNDLADVLEAKENLTTVQADINQFKRRLTNEVYAFDILLGQTPGTTDVTASSFPVLPPPLDVAVCVPASLLDRRPDLKANEFRLIAANADIGVAVADLYPSLNLSGALGFSGNETPNFFSADQLAGSIVGALTTRLFEGGRLRANIDLQEAEAEELIHAYSGEVLQAIGDVESALQAENELIDEVTFLSRSVESLKKAEEVSQKRYQSGIITLRDFLDTQQRRYQIEQSAISREQEKWNTRIALYLALGGDWQKQNNQQEEACP